jgi:hypothetical protein
MENRMTLTSCILPAGGRAPVVAALALLTATLAPATAYESKAGNTENSAINPPIARAASSTSGRAKNQVLISSSSISCLADEGEMKTPLGVRLIPSPITKPIMGTKTETKQKKQSEELL